MPSRRRADRPRCRAYQGAGQGHGVGQEARRPGEVQARGASVRRLSAAEAAGARQCAAGAGGQFPLALFRPVLCRAGAGLLHVPPADAERHFEALAARRSCRSRRKLRGRLQPRHHPRQSADPRNPAEECGDADRRHPGSRPVLARRRRRQHPQCHGHADGRHRSAGTAGYAALCARVALPHPQRPLALRPAAQVQCRLRWRRQDRGAGRHQRHRVLSGRSEGRPRHRARHLVPARHRRHHRAQGFRQGDRHHRQAGRRHQGGGRDRPRLHRHRRPHQPAQGAAEIRARQHGRRQVHGRCGGTTRPQADPRAGRSDRAASGLRPHGPYRRAQTEAGRA